MCICVSRWQVCGSLSGRFLWGWGEPGLWAVSPRLSYLRRAKIWRLWHLRGRFYAEERGVFKGQTALLWDTLHKQYGKCSFYLGTKWCQHNRFVSTCTRKMWCWLSTTSFTLTSNPKAVNYWSMQCNILNNTSFSPFHPMEESSPHFFLSSVSFMSTYFVLFTTRSGWMWAVPLLL